MESTTATARHPIGVAGDGRRIIAGVRIAMRFWAALELAPRRRATAVLGYHLMQDVGVSRSDLDPSPRQL
ncbi:MAG: hypothetical protein ACREEV_00945 [Dongiaceae bacterium]